MPPLRLRSPGAASHNGAYVASRAAMVKKVLPGKETYVVPAGDRLIAEMPGGGGYGKK